jgi:Na+/melibiose symporter-like transporter
MFEFLMSKDGDKLLWNVLICIVLISAMWMLLSWIKKRERELRAEKEKRSRVFANEIAHMKECFAECTNRRQLMHEELKIDSFKWYWLAFKSSDQVNRAVEDLYKAYYSRLKSFSKIAKD